MDVIQAIIYGIVQGLTEFLPISSTAHIRILPAVMGWEDPGSAFTAAIQLGTMLAVVIFFWKDLVTICHGFLTAMKTENRMDSPEFRQGLGIILGTIPILIVGYLMKDFISNEGRSLWIIAGSLIGMGLLLAVAERVGSQKRNLSDVRVSDGLWVGLWQVISLIPGSSRSGSTITGALFLGLDRAAAARYSFLLSIPSIVAAGVYSLYSSRKELLGDDLVPMLIANVFSFVVGFISIKMLMNFLSTNRTTIFVVYRLILGAGLLIALSAGKLAAL